MMDGSRVTVTLARRLFNSILIIVDQAAIPAAFDSRRQAKAETLYMGMMPLGFAGSTRAPRGPV
jgi:hypothetical protein